MSTSAASKRRPARRSLLWLVVGLAMVGLPLVWVLSTVSATDEARAEAPECAEGVVPSGTECRLIGPAQVERVYSRTSERQGRVVDEDLLVDLVGPDGRTRTAELADLEDWRTIPADRPVTAELWDDRIWGLEVDGAAVETLTPRAGGGATFLVFLVMITGALVTVAALIGLIAAGVRRLRA